MQRVAPVRNCPAYSALLNTESFVVELLGALSRKSLPKAMLSVHDAVVKTMAMAATALANALASFVFSVMSVVV